MGLGGFLDFVPIIGKVIDKIFPDPAVAADAKLKLLELQQKGEMAWLDADVKLALGQMEVNKVEAASPSLFKSGWRPAVGWLCVAGFAYASIVRPMLPWIATVAGLQVPPLPAMDTAELMTILMGMLGLGGMRTAERLQGKA